MSRSLQNVAILLVLPVVMAACVHRLIASPDALMVDGKTISVDNADRGHTRTVGNDLTSVILPRFLYIVGQTKEHGKSPNWDATGFGGRPLVGNPQAGLHYPPIWLAWWSGRPSALGWLTVGHLLGAGIGVYVLARSLGMGRPASVVAGGCFQASPYLIAHTFEGHYPHVWSACWYPWAFWALRLALMGRVSGYAVLPAVLALSFTTGHPQEWYYLVVALSAWTLFDGWKAYREGEAKKGARQVLIWAGILGVSLGLCAIDLLPGLLVQPWLLKRGAIPLTLVNRYQIHPANLLQLFDPFALGRPDTYAGHDNYWEAVLSIGFAPLVLGVIGIAYAGPRWDARRWGVLVVAAVVFAAGRKMGLYALLYELLPGMERFRVPARTLFLASLGASVLAGAGVQVLLDREIDFSAWNCLRNRLRIGLAATVLAVWLAGFLPFPHHSGNRLNLQTVSTDLARKTVLKASLKRDVQPVSMMFWVSAGALFGFVSWGRDPARGKAIAGWGIGAVALVELTFYAQSLLVCTPVDAFVSRRIFNKDLSEANGPLRVASVGSLFTDLEASATGTEKTNVNDSFQIQHAADLYENLYAILEAHRYLRDKEYPLDSVADRFHAATARSAMDLLSAGYLVADRPISVEGLDKEACARQNDPVAIWRNAGALPRAYVVPRSQPDPGPSAGNLALRIAEMDPHQGVFLERDPIQGNERQPFTPAQWLSADPDRVTIAVETTAPGLLVVGTTWMPGWTATVNGTQERVLRGNHWQQVVPLRKSGRQEIVLRYDPPGLAAGSAIAAATLIVWSGVTVMVGWGRLRVREVFTWLSMSRWLENAGNRFRPIRGVFGRTIRA